MVNTAAETMAELSRGPHTAETTAELPFWAWIISLNIRFGGSFYFLAYFTFLWYGIDSTVHMYHILIIGSSADEHPGGFHLLSVVNKAAMNVDVQASL